MFKNLFGLFGAAEAEKAAVAEAKDDRGLAMAALMVEAARADDDYADVEKEMIDRILAETEGLTETEASALRLRGEKAQAEAMDIFRFSHTLKERCDEAERAEILEKIWRVILTDESRHAREDGLMRKLTGLFYLPDRESALARQRAAEALQSEGER